MGVSTDGILAYGVELPNEFESDEAWEKYGFVDKYADDTPEGEGWDGIEDFVSDVCKARGVPGIILVRHCSFDYPMYILATRYHSAWRGSPSRIASLDVPADETLRIGQALEVLGIHVDKPEPAWLLASLWG